MAENKNTNPQNELGYPDDGTQADISLQELPADAPAQQDELANAPETPYAMTPYDEAAEFGPVKKKRNKKRMVIAGVAIALVLAVVGWMVWGTLQGPAATYVQTQAVVRGDIQQTLTTTGKLVTGEKVTIFSPVSAPLTAVEAELGRPVTAGAPLFAFSTTDLERAYSQAAAQSNLAGLQQQAAINNSNEAGENAAAYQAGVDNISYQRDVAQGRVNTAQSDYDALAAAIGPNLEAAKTELAQLQTLQDPSEAEKARMFELSKQITEMNAQLQAAATNLQVQKEDLAYQNTLLSQLRQAHDTAEQGVLDQNGRQQLQTQQVAPAVGLAAARDNLANARAGVTAPITGVVTSLTGEVGAMAAQYSPLCVIESLDKVNVVVSLSRYDLERVQEGQRAIVTTLGHEYEATITKINSMATDSISSSGTTTSFVACTVTIKNPDTNIRLGLEATVDIFTGHAQDVLMMPVLAVNTDVEGTYCFIMENGVAVRRTVEVGLSSDTEVEVLSGLNEGDQVILNSQNILEGMPLTNDPAAAPPANAMQGIMIG